MRFEDVVAEYHVRMDARGPLLNYMREARDHFNGDIVIPMPEMQNNERPAVANLMMQGLDQTAMRVASVMPNLVVPPLIPGKDKGEKSEDWARKRRMAMMGWWQESRLNLKLRRSARWTVGYGSSTMFVRPDFESGIPRYELRDPLSAFPNLNVTYDDDQPIDYIYAFHRSYRWLRQNYPDAATVLARQLKTTPKDNVIIELLEYIGPDHRILGVLATRPAEGSKSMFWTPSSHQTSQAISGVELFNVPNKAGICWGVESNRITIDRLQGQFQQVFGIYQNQARLMALETIAVEKAIFPDVVVQGNVPGRTPQLINGSWKDGRSGEINMIRDGNVQALQLNPGFMTQPLIDRHERNIRQAGVPSQFSGETPTGISTGRMGDQILSASVDFPIQEYQESLAVSLEEANKRAIAICKAYFGEEKKSFYVGFGGTAGHVDYTPNTHFETDAHRVMYASPGADVNSLVIGIGQRIGIGTMSKWTAMQQDPMVPDPDYEYRKVNSERIQTALLEYVSQAVATGALDPQDVLLLWEEVEKGSNIADAWKKAQQAAQKRQAEAAQAQQAAAQQQGVSPEDQQGLSPPGNPEEAGTAIGPPQPSQQNLANLLGTLRQPRSITSPMASSNATPSQTPVG